MNEWKIIIYYVVEKFILNKFIFFKRFRLNVLIIANLESMYMNVATCNLESRAGAYLVGKIADSGLCFHLILNDIDNQMNVIILMICLENIHKISTIFDYYKQLPSYFHSM